MLGPFGARPKGATSKSVSEGLYPLPTVSSPPTRSASDGFGHSAGQASRLPDGGPGPPTGTLAGASGWCDEPAVVVVNGQRAASVSLTMIVRNEQDHLAKCLESVRGLFDEIIIVDTGSTDRTKEIAREFGAKVFDFVWIDDFAAARNEALSHATGDYAFWLDADDVVEPAEREKLEALFSGLGRASAGNTTGAMSAVTPPLTRPAGDLSPGRGDDDRPGDANGKSADPPSLGAGLMAPPTPPGPPFARGGKGSLGAAVGAADGLFAYVMRCACPPGHDGTRGGTVVDHVRLFPIRPGVRWTYRVHEQILPSLNRAKIPARWTDIVIRHDGYADPDVEARKLERNIKILERELIERPDDPFVLFNLGSSAVQQKDYHAALGLLERSLALSAPRDSIVRKLYALIARVHQMTGDSQEALRTCAGGIEARRSGRRVMAPQGGHSSPSWRIAEAERSWRRILELKRPEQYCSFDNGIYGHVTRRNLARLAAERGDVAEAGRLWCEVLTECPGDAQALAWLTGRGPGTIPSCANSASEP